MSAGEALNPLKTAPELEPQTTYQRVVFAKGLLHLHGFLMEAENAKIQRRINAWLTAYDEKTYGGQP